MSAHGMGGAFSRWARRGPAIVTVLLLLGLCSAMALTPTRRLLEQNERLDATRSDLARTRHINQRLEDRIDRLQNPDFIEQRARSQIGLVYPGETSYVVMPPSKTVQTESKIEAARRKAAVAPPPEPSLIEGFLQFVGLGWLS